VSLNGIQTVGNSRKTQETKSWQSFMKLLWNWRFFVNIFVTFLPKFKQRWSWQKFCKILSNLYQLVIFGILLFKILSNFWQLVTFGYCFWKIDKFLLKIREIANKKSWPNVVKRLWILFQHFVDHELNCAKLLSMFWER